MRQGRPRRAGRRRPADDADRWADGRRNRGLTRAEIAFAASRADYAACVQIRTQVFVVEQGVDAALEIDAAEDDAVHILARVDGVAAGTLRWRRYDAAAVKIERVAVLPAYRGTGVGAALMRWAITAIRDADEIIIGAQVDAIAFYERLGFAAFGAVYDDAGIPHRKMRRVMT